VRVTVRKLLDRPAIPLNVKVHDTRTDNGLVTEHAREMTEAERRQRGRARDG